MLSRLFPRTLTNTYQGSWIALWLLAPVLVIKTLMGFNFSGLNPLVNVADILSTVDGVPIETFTQEAAKAVLASAKPARFGPSSLASYLVVWSTRQELSAPRLKTRIRIYFNVFIVLCYFRLFTPEDLVCEGVWLCGYIFTVG